MKIKCAKSEQVTISLLQFSGEAIEIQKLHQLCLACQVTLFQIGPEWVGQFSIFQLYFIEAHWATYFGQENATLRQLRQQRQLLWVGPSFKFNLTVAPIIYAIINCTPDSFYDGQPSQQLAQIMLKIETDLANGATVIEVGGKSTRPGFQELTADEEWQRIAPVIKAVQQEWPAVTLAVDTNNAEVMHRAVTSGVPILNDIDGFNQADKLAVVMQSQASVVTMYNGRHFTADTFETLDQFYQTTLAALTAAGLVRQQIALDPGVGFSYARNTASLDLFKIKSVTATQRYQTPIMAAISRKSFMEKRFNYPMDDRLTATLLFEQLMVEQGARILRVHDVSATQKMLHLVEGYQQANLLMAAQG